VASEVEIVESQGDVRQNNAETCVSPLSSSQTDRMILSTKSSFAQTDSMDEEAFLTFNRLSKDKSLLHYYTGLENADKLFAVFSSLGAAAYNLTYYRTVSTNGISPLNQFILMLAKLRQDLDYLPLSHLCGVSKFTAQNIFITWVNFCSRQWGDINTWTSQDLTHYYAPVDFKLKFPTTRVIVDGTEIPIKKTANPISQRATFSTYKNRNTVKVVIGSTPGGLISYLSPAYGGATSDRQII